MFRGHGAWRSSVQGLLTLGQLLARADSLCDGFSSSTWETLPFQKMMSRKFFRLCTADVCFIQLVQSEKKPPVETGGLAADNLCLSWGLVRLSC
jgi:hypothetical protein